MKICILTSGGDSPGMNAAVRAVVRSAIEQGHDVFGVQAGYEGLMQGCFEPLNLRSVANIIHRGGTFLKSKRSKGFLSKEGRDKAVQALKAKAITGVVALGGDGTLAGIEVLHKEQNHLSCYGIPCTIDNDYKFSEESIGFDTALNTALQAVDRIRDTASSHQRTFVIEVMGRSSRLLADAVALAVGAECVVDPNRPESLIRAVQVVKESIQRGKKASLIIALESKAATESFAHQVQSELYKQLEVDCRAVVLGHIQRGGSPTGRDRILASQMGCAIGEQIGKAATGLAIVEGGVVKAVPFKGRKERRAFKSADSMLKTLAN